MKRWKNQFNNEKGLTLIETLGVFVILSIIIFFLLNITLASTKQGNIQTKESYQINDAAFILKQITKDLRKTSKVIPIGLNYNFNKRDDTLVVSYHYENNILYRNGQILANNISDFIIDTSNNNKVEISFIINSEEFRTTISLRKGDF